MTSKHASSIAIAVMLGAACAPTSMEPPTSHARDAQAAIFTVPGKPGFSSITGTMRVTTRPDSHGVRSFAFVTARKPFELDRVVRGTFPDDTSLVASFNIDSLPAGTWRLQYSERHPYTAIFPVMKLSFDSTITVKVRDGSNKVLPEVALTPVAPFLVIATEICPWPLQAPMTSDQWGECDGGYWGGLDVEVLVRGIAGTATAGVEKAFVIKQETWFTELRTLPPGEYDVSGTARQREPGASQKCATGWQLVPWRAPTQRMRVVGGLAYTEFEFWCQLS